MRVYALLLGIVFTAGYGFAAQVAVSSVGAGRHSDAASAATGVATETLDHVWYGGFIDPITVESKRGAAETPVTRQWLLDRPAPRCIQTAVTGSHAVS